MNIGNYIILRIIISHFLTYYKGKCVENVECVLQQFGYPDFGSCKYILSRAAMFVRKI